MTPATVTRLAGLTAAAAIAVAVAVLPAPALAAGGTTTLVLDGPAASSLRSQGVTIAAESPAKGGSRRIVLPISAGLAGSSTTLLRQRGAISLKAGAKKLRLAKLSVVVGKRSRVEARIGAESVALFKILPGGRRDVDPATGKVDFANLKLKLTAGGAGAIARRLGLEKLRPKRFGSLAAAVSGLTPGGETPGGGGPEAARCALPSGAGPAPEDPLPPAPAAPLGAAAISGATIDWHVRESFIRYIDTGEGTSVSGGASAGPPVLLPGASAALSYDFHFPFASGWLDDGADPANPADDTARVEFDGAVRFQYSAHGIDLTTADPEIELAGANSRAIFTITDGAKPSERQVLINLDLSRAGAIKVAGNAYTYERVPGAIPAGTASSTFAGFYAPGTDFGCVTVSFTAAP